MKNNDRPKQIDIRTVKDKKSLSDYLKRLIWIEKQRENN